MLALGIKMYLPPKAPRDGYRTRIWGEGGGVQEINKNSFITMITQTAFFLHCIRGVGLREKVQVTFTACLRWYLGSVFLWIWPPVCEGLYGEKRNI